MPRQLLVARSVGSSSIETKVAVYKAVCIYALLYGCEAWTTYSSHVRNLESFHIRCLQRILGVPHATILQLTNCISIEALIIQQQLRWIGHVIRMPKNRLPRKLFYGELAHGTRNSGGQKKRYKDRLHSILKQCNIPATQLETLVSDRAEWRCICKQAVDTFEATRTKAREDRRQLRYQRLDQPALPTKAGVSCPSCGRLCASSFGLRSHMRIHR